MYYNMYVFTTDLLSGLLSTSFAFIWGLDGAV